MRSARGLHTSTNVLSGNTRTSSLLASLLVSGSKLMLLSRVRTVENRWTTGFGIRCAGFIGRAEIARMSSTVSFVDDLKEKLGFLKARFYFKRGEISVLNSPKEFYDTLKERILSAQDRIFIASLYIGKTQDELIDHLREALEKNPKLKVHVLVDGLRGTREAPSKCSVTLISRLLEDYHERVDIRLYRTPACVGWKGSILPRRINEGLGLQHMKIYGFDDEIILSGANLSSDYFTNRQDRYYVFRSKPFSDYYYDLHQLISRLSYRVKSSTNSQKFSIFWPHQNLAVDPVHDRAKFIKKASTVLSEFLLAQPEPTKKGMLPNEDYPTVVYPVSQFTPLFQKGRDNSTEKPTILRLISSISKPSISWTFTAGYFNMFPDIKRGLISTPSEQATVITASPYANGFFESKGVSGNLPDAYLHLSKKFLRTVKRHGKEANIILREWKRGVVNKPGGWSYHAKGLWIGDVDNGDRRPMLTCIGSSNYTRRAYSLDLESNAVILTRDEELRDKMQQELDSLLEHTEEVTLGDFDKEPHRKVSTGVKVATYLLGKRL